METEIKEMVKDIAEGKAWKRIAIESAERDALYARHPHAAAGGDGVWNNHGNDDSKPTPHPDGNLNDWMTW